MDLYCTQKPGQQHTPNEPRADEAERTPKVGQPDGLAEAASLGSVRHPISKVKVRGLERWHSTQE